MPFDGSTFETTRTRDDILRDWCHELRHGGHEQLRHNLCNKDLTELCAVGVLMFRVRDGRTLHTSNHPRDMAVVNDARSMNDAARRSFSEIADYIESEWLGR